MDYEGNPVLRGLQLPSTRARAAAPTAAWASATASRACQYGAISIVDGIAVVDKAVCVGCGMCAKACPNHLITIIPATSTVYVGCSSHDKGAFTRKVCKNGCIGCKKCEKTCENGAITVTDNLASIDPRKCTSCGACVTACPTGAIVTCASRCEAIVGE